MIAEPEETDGELIDFTDLSPERKLDAIFGTLCAVMGRLDGLENLAIAKFGEDGELIIAYPEGSA